MDENTSISKRLKFKARRKSILAKKGLTGFGLARDLNLIEITVTQWIAGINPSQHWFQEYFCHKLFGNLTKKQMRKKILHYFGYIGSGVEKG